MSEATSSTRRLITHRLSDRFPEWKERLTAMTDNHWALYLLPVLDQVNKAIKRWNPRLLDCKAFLPYCLHKISEGLEEGDGLDRLYKTHIWLNRFYKPIGTSCPVQVNYNDFKHLHVDMQGPFIVQLRNSPHVSHSYNGVWLFQDGQEPWSSKEMAIRYGKLISLALGVSN